MWYYSYLAHTSNSKVFVSTVKTVGSFKSTWNFGKTESNKSLLYKEDMVFLFRMDPFQKGGKNILKWLPPFKMYLFPLKAQYSSKIDTFYLRKVW